MKESIGFNTEMINAIREGRKTQTRRPIKPQPLNVIYHKGRWMQGACEADPTDRTLLCPYEEGQVLIVRGTNITLEVTSVGVERVQEISETDAKAEGYKDVIGKYARGDEARIWFAELWNGIYSKRGWGWFENPWVFVIGFKVVDTQEAG